MDSGTRLNAAQQSAVEASESRVLVIAGPGSGKTAVLVEHAKHLLSQGIHPTEMLLLTFTNAAAFEMRARLQANLGEEASLPYIGTFHSYCANLLRLFGENTPVGRQFSIYDAIDQRDIVIRLIAEFKLKVSADKIIRALQYDEIEPKDEYEIGFAVGQYKDKLVSYRGIDFRGLLEGALGLLNQYDVARRMKFILVDEYQDTNIIQEAILKAHKADHLFVVGDPNQAIYGFRFATPEHIKSFTERYEGAGSYKLEDNYRSSPEIVALANDLIKDNILTLRPQCTSKGTVKIPWFPDPECEAWFIAKEIEQLVANDEHPGEIAVLSRTNKRLIPVAEQMTIPYVLATGDSIWDTEPCRVLIGALSLMHNQYDEIRFEGLLSFYGAGPKLLRKLRMAARQNRITLAQAGCAGTGRFGRVCKSITRNRETVNSYLQGDKNLLASELVALFIDEACPIDIFLEAGKDTKAAQIWHTLSAIEAWEQNHGDPDYWEFLKWYRLRDLQDKLDKGTKVNLTTIHGSKGLEWSTVFIIGTVDGHYPHMKAATQDEIDEERRMFYVGITRAKRRLYLTGYDGNMYGTHWTDRVSSPYLTDLKLVKERV